MKFLTTLMLGSYLMLATATSSLPQERQEFKVLTVQTFTTQDGTKYDVAYYLTKEEILHDGVVVFWGIAESKGTGYILTRFVVNCDKRTFSPSVQWASFGDRHTLTLSDETLPIKENSVIALGAVKVCGVKA